MIHATLFFANKTLIFDNFSKIKVLKSKIKVDDIKKLITFAPSPEDSGQR